MGAEQTVRLRYYLFCDRIMVRVRCLFGGFIMVLDDKSRAILEELCKKHDVRKLTLFGSRARGDCHDRSDIDIAVEGISTSSEYFDLVDDIDDSDIIYLVDVVNLDSMLVSTVIAEEIEKDGVVLYEEV